MSAFNSLIQHQILEITRKVSIGPNLLDELVECVDLFCQEYDTLNIVLACGKEQSLVRTQEVRSALALAKIEVLDLLQIESSRTTEVARVRKHLDFSRRNLVIAIGGGTVIDVCKAAVDSEKDPLILFPTVLSSDCIYSPITVLRNDAGDHVSYKARYPSALLVDTEYLRGSPQKFTVAGIGDVLSNASALLDCRYARRHDKQINGLASVLSGASVEILTGIQTPFENNERCLEVLGEALVMSGLAMAVSEDTRPCSGAEHLVSHALDKMNVGSGLHGEQVALAMLYLNKLRGLLGLETISDEVTEFCKAIGLPGHPNELGISKDQFISAVGTAPKMRPDRVTILSDNVSKQVVDDAYEQAFSKSA